MAWPFHPHKPLQRRWSSRLTVELVVIVIVKLIALCLIWWFAFAPYPHPGHDRGAIERLLAPDSALSPIHETKP